MNHWEWLDRLLRQQTIGDEERDLIQKLLQHYNLFALSGRNKLALMLFLARCIREIIRAFHAFRMKYRT